MILFMADDHYNSHPGLNIHSQLKDSYDISFYENDWSGFARLDSPDCRLLILNMIADTCGNPLPDAGAEASVLRYLHGGGHVLMLHGSSAAFWHWDWWRPCVGFRWVRNNDPDAVPASTHPKRPYAVRVSKTRHALASILQPMSLPTDEIYIDLEQTCPASIIMETHTDEGTFPQCHECLNPWGGLMLGFIPGHSPEVTTSPGFVANVKILVDYLINQPRLQKNRKEHTI